MQYITKKRRLPVLVFSVALTLGASAQNNSGKQAVDTLSSPKAGTTSDLRMKGVILDGNTQRPLTGVSVTVAGYSSSLTDENGKFKIRVPHANAHITVALEGYHSRILPGRAGKEVSVVLYPQTYTSQFQEADLPYQTQNKAQAVSSVEVVQPAGGWFANSETPDTYIQGRVAGASIVRRSATPGMGSEVFLRGFSSLFANNKPLYVVDGTIFDPNSYGTSLHSGHVNNPLQFIDIHDIQSINFIKDAPISALYGTRAANGVVLIKTLHAAELATKIDFTAYTGLNQRPAGLPVLNAYDFRVYLSDQLASRGLSSTAIANQPYMIDDPANPNYYTYHKYSTNWQREVFKPSVDQSYMLRVSGGDNVAKYVLSTGFTNDRGVIDNTKNTRFNTRLNADLNLTRKLSSNMNLAFSYSEQALKAQGLDTRANPILLALVKAPFLSKYSINVAGEVSPNFADYDTLGVSNPASILERGLNQTKSLRFFGSFKFDYKLSSSVKISNTTGVTFDKSQETLYIPDKGVKNDTLITEGVRRSVHGSGTVRYFSLYNDLTIGWQKVYAYQHAFSAMLGARIHTNQSEQDYALGYNAATDYLININNSNVSTRDLGGQVGDWNVLSSYFSGNYSYSNKYLFNVSMAVDGSSRFGINNRYAFLPAVGAAWIVSSEDFLKDNTQIDLLKFRLSYGWVGNDGIGNYTARRYYSSQNLFGLQGLTLKNLNNPSLKWERVRKFNLGLDLAAFRERLNLTVDYWNHRTTDLLTMANVATIPSVAGISSFSENAGALSTQGWDISLYGRVLNTKKLKWDAGITLGIYRNKVTSLPNGSFLSPVANGQYITLEGEAANQFYGYSTNGVYASTAEAQASGMLLKLSNGSLVPVRAGDVRFVNVFDTPEDIANNRTVIDENDRQIIGNPNPDFTGSVNHTFSYKRWSLGALFTFSVGNEVYNYTRSVLESGSNYNNQSVALNNRWRYEGQVTDIPRAEYGDPRGNARFSDRWIENGSYLRLRTLTLGYDFNLKNKSVKYVRVYATGNNVFTLTNYLGFDPEFSSSSSIYGQGVDLLMEPQFQSFQLGLRLGL